MESNRPFDKNEKDIGENREAKTEQAVTTEQTKELSVLVGEIEDFFEFLRQAKTMKNININKNNVDLLNLVQKDFLEYLRSINKEEISELQKNKLLDRIYSLTQNLQVFASYTLIKDIIVAITSGNLESLKAYYSSKEAFETFDQMIGRLDTMRSAELNPSDNSPSMVYLNLIASGVKQARSKCFRNAFKYFEKAKEELETTKVKNPHLDISHPIEQIIELTNSSLSELARQLYEQYSSNTKSQDLLEEAINYMDKITNKSVEVSATLIQWRLSLLDLYLQKGQINECLEQIDKIYPLFEIIMTRYIFMALPPKECDRIRNKDYDIDPSGADKNVLAMIRKVLVPIQEFSQRVITELHKLAEGCITDENFDLSKNQKGIFYCNKAFQYIINLEETSEILKFSYADEERIALEQLKVQLCNQYLNYLDSIPEITKDDPEILNKALAQLSEAKNQLNKTLEKNNLLDNEETKTTRPSSLSPQMHRLFDPATKESEEVPEDEDQQEEKKNNKRRKTQ